MRLLCLILLAIMLTGCDREVPPSAGGENDPANSNATPAAGAAKSDTLKITYSKFDPFEQSKATPKAAEPETPAPAHAGHSEKEKPAVSEPKPALKPDHEEHQKK